jgi:hypothetical protein
MRCPLIIGVAQGVTAQQALPDVDRITPSTAGDGAFELRKGPHRALAYRLGNAKVGATTYRVYAVLVDAGDQRKVYRFLQTQNVQGPYTRHNAPAPLKTWLRELTAQRDKDGAVISPGKETIPVLWAGEDDEQLDALDYTEGADLSGELDEVAQVVAQPQALAPSSLEAESR